MLRLSKKADYALIAMKHLALRGDRGSSSAREIAELYDIPIELMAKVLQRLVRRGLLASHQGTRGGYQLARAAGADFGGRRHPGDRRPGDRDRLLDRRRPVRAVREMQRARSAVAGARADSGGARRVHDRGAGGGSAAAGAARAPRCCIRICDARFSSRENDGYQTSDLPGLSRDDAGRSARGRGDAAVLHASTSATPPAATIRSAGRRKKRSRRRASRSPI